MSSQKVLGSQVRILPHVLSEQKMLYNSNINKNVLRIFSEINLGLH